MSNWTTTAREALERYLEKNRANLVLADGDADEVIGDLRRHVEAEIAGLGLSTVTEQDVYRILARIGPVSTESAQLPPMPPSVPKSSPFSAFRSGLLFLFGFLLPAATLLIELGTHMCAMDFFDPLPTWLHVFLIALVPISNLLVWQRSSTELSQKMARWLWWSNSVAFGVSLFYAAVFLPMSPFAVIGILVIGLGLLPLSPLLSMICVLVLRRRLRRQIEARGLVVPRFWGRSAVLTVFLLVVLAVPTPLTQYLIDEASSESEAQSLRAVKLLRWFGSEDVLLKQCYGRVDRLWGWQGGFGDSSKAQSVFYRVTGKPFNSVPPPLNRYARGGTDVFDEFDWDDGLGGEEVAGRVKGLSIAASRIDGICKAEEGWAYMEWIMEFRNEHANRQREARVQIQLPPGAVVSRVTLWVNGEEREAAFAGRGDVRAAYQKVAVQERRDPVLVTTSGPDRVLVQCFPVQPRGGTMKIRIGITAPLHLEKERAALRLPCFVERNFKVPQSFEHSVWLESSVAPSAGTKKLVTNTSEGGKSGIRGLIGEQELSSPQSVLWFKASDGEKTTFALDKRAGNEAIIKQTIESVTIKTPSRIAIVLDGSKGMTEFFPRIANVLNGIPSQPELCIWCAQDGLEKIYDSSWQRRDPPAKAVGPLRGVGGQDNIPGLLQAWEWAAAKPDGVVLWIHGAQPMVLSNIEALKQRTDWQSAGNGPVILDVAVEPGPNRLAEKLSVTPVLHGILRLGKIEEDLERLFSLWSHRTTEFQFVRSVDASTEGKMSPPGSLHIVRLWAAQEIQRLVNERKVNDSVNLAGLYQLVTSVSGAVVLETKQQYKEAGLTPVDPALVPMVVPEPSTWALLLIGIVVLVFVGRMRAVRNIPHR